MNFLVLLAAMLVSAPAMAQVNTVTPTQFPAGAVPSSNASPMAIVAPTGATVTDAEMNELLGLLQSGQVAQQAANSNQAMFDQILTQRVTQAGQQRGQSAQAQILQAGMRAKERFATFQGQVGQWMRAEYIKRHRATYTPDETRQLLAFMRSTAGRKYVGQEPQNWAAILQQSNQQAASMIQNLVNQAFAEAGL
ncbi:MAG: DUF2059 domain-containing protein [Bdellovibrionales bacterium]